MKKIIFILTGILLSFSLHSQTERPITTGVPFLMIAADARAAGMADIGVATSPDAFSQQYNPAKFAFSLKKQAFSVSYTPYLTALVNDIALGQLTYFNRINERSAVAGTLRYFSQGEIQLTDEQGQQLNIVKPNELALDLSYGLQLSDRFSMAVAARYIRSNLRIPIGANDASSASTFAVDVAGFYQSEEVAFNSFNGRWRAGFNFQNLGPKIAYDKGVAEESANFLPANLRLGGSYDFIFDEYNKVSANVEFTKLMVPTPQQVVAVDSNANGVIDQSELNTARAKANDDYRKVGWTSGIFKSFGDAPDGFKEELREFTYAIGAEYNYKDSFAFRAGYFNEAEEKGKRKYFTIGAGFKYNVVGLDVSYLFSTSKVPNPLENTLRFSLTLNFGDDYDDY